MLALLSSPLKKKKKNDWTRLEEPYGSIFLSIPTVLDSSLAPEGRHILHIFTTSSIEDWEVRIVLSKLH